MFNKNKFLYSFLIILAVFLVSFFIQTNSVEAIIVCDKSTEDSCRINHSIEKTVKVDGRIYSVINTSALAADNIFIPLKTSGEWAAFKTFHPNHITITEDPCDGITAASYFFKGNLVSYGTVANLATGECWLDRNLGSYQVATSSTDSYAYGNLFQWGRSNDNHQFRISGTTSTRSFSDNPGHGNFITTSAEPYDWRSPQNGSLWQGVYGINNPCPSVFRIPTGTELYNEELSWSSNDATGAFASPLKLPVAGFRTSNGNVSGVRSQGTYWSSTSGTSYSDSIGFNSTSASAGAQYRSIGNSVRCIMDRTRTSPVTLYFNSDGGTYVTPIRADAGTEVSIPADPTKAGYTFVDWFPLIPIYNGPPINTTIMPSSDQVYKATWDGPFYTIFFDSDGGSYVSPITQEGGTTVTRPPDPTKQSYLFDGWSPIFPSTMPYANQTYIAQWRSNLDPIK